MDEAGRGPWAGPVVAGAVILSTENISAQLRSGLDDSKKLSPVKREKLFRLLPSYAVIGVGFSDIDEIDSLNILQASLLAMERALEKLAQKPDYALVDGNKLPNQSCSGECVIRGDSRSLSIAAASIVAKVTRDQVMKHLGNGYNNILLTITGKQIKI